MKRKEREELGTQLYNLQYELTRQTDYLEKQEHELDEMTEKRLAVEVAAEELRKINLQLQEEVKAEIDEGLGWVYNFVFLIPRSLLNIYFF